MRKVSIWARFHPQQARIYIVIIKIILWGMAIVTGKTIAETGIILSPLPVVICAIILILAASVYPQKSATGYSGKQNYTLRKSLDFTLAFTTFILISSLVANTNSAVSNPRLPLVSEASANKVNPPTADEILASLKYRDKSTLTQQEKRILKKEFGKQLLVYAKAKVSGDKNGAKALLIILTIIGAIGLTYVLAGLACSISCSGADGLAILVAVVGLTGILWGTIATIKAIKRHYGKKKGDAKDIPSNTN
jgi:hypothetical protein